ncbi:RNA-protein complex protein Nop10 [Candidatus Micrarchaeota archaeon]|nr:RNA-protein complex protein Nop10 [Candidatus Micrarchaeota archaeon]MBU1166509.1 RNA-protein complex protein Nop10 [Candidatus Micrarchaeota archaeon]MBU1887521.1 RNA-protein complex protein Nop10 [Candidatus Micrarchaeota archaeon]
MYKIRRCFACGGYTLSTIHCEKSTVSAHPPKFNPDDRFGDQRRAVKYHEPNQKN